MLVEMKDYSMVMKYLDTREGDGRVGKREGGWKVKEDRREGKVKEVEIGKAVINPR